MTIEPPAPGEPRRPHGPRDPGDAWVVAPTGEKSGDVSAPRALLASTPERGVLLQHRVSWSHFAAPGRCPAERVTRGSPLATVPCASRRKRPVCPWMRARALRERPRSGYLVVLHARRRRHDALRAGHQRPRERGPRVGRGRSGDDLPLHPGFASAWPALRAALGSRRRSWSTWPTSWGRFPMAGGRIAQEPRPASSRSSPVSPSRGWMPTSSASPPRVGSRGWSPLLEDSLGRRSPWLRPSRSAAPRVRVMTRSSRPCAGSWGVRSVVVVTATVSSRPRRGSRRDRARRTLGAGSAG